MKSMPNFRPIRLDLEVQLCKEIEDRLSNSRQISPLTDLKKYAKILADAYAYVHELASDRAYNQLGSYIKLAEGIPRQRALIEDQIRGVEMCPEVTDIGRLLRQTYP